MHIFLMVLGTALFLAVCIGGLGLLIVGLPGTWLIVAATAVFAFATHGVSIPYWGVGVFFALAAGAEIFEVFVGAYGAKKYGGSKWAMVGAVVGGIGGVLLLSPILPVIGTIIGAFGGAFAGAFGLEYAVNRDIRQAKASGFGALLGRLAAVAAKAGLSVAIIISAMLLIITG